MATAFSNNTANLTSSERTSNSKAKTNYNYLRLVSLKNVDNVNPQYVGCNNKRFSSSSGNVILGYDSNTPPKRSSLTGEAILSKLINARSYELRNSINKGFYLPTTIPKNNTTNDNINRPPYTYDPACQSYFTPDGVIVTYTQPNTSGDLQEILFNEYLDFGDATLVTNTQFIKDENTGNDIPFKTMYSNQVQVTDASFGDYIIDPDNIITNYKDSDLPTYLDLQNNTTSYSDSSNGQEKILKIINWRKLQINTFPNNKYHRFSVNEPIKFYNYDACLSAATAPPPDIDKSDIKEISDSSWNPGKDEIDGSGVGPSNNGIPALSGNTFANSDIQASTT